MTFNQALFTFLAVFAMLSVYFLASKLINLLDKHLAAFTLSLDKLVEAQENLNMKIDYILRSLS